jgi:hypothetical protein
MPLDRVATDFRRVERDQTQQNSEMVRSVEIGGLLLRMSAPLRPPSSVAAGLIGKAYFVISPLSYFTATCPVMPYSR